MSHESPFCERTCGNKSFFEQASARKLNPCKSFLLRKLPKNGYFRSKYLRKIPLKFEIRLDFNVVLGRF